MKRLFSLILISAVVLSPPAAFADFQDDLDPYRWLKEKGDDFIFMSRILSKESNLLRKESRIKKRQGKLFIFFIVCTLLVYNLLII